MVIKGVSIYMVIQDVSVYTIIYGVSIYMVILGVSIHMVMLYSCNTNISRDIIKHDIRTSMNERTHFFIEIYLSHFIIDRVMFVVCEIWAGDRDRQLYWPMFSLDHSSTSSSSWQELLNRGSLSAQSSLSATDSHLGILSPTNSNRLCTWLYYFLMSTCFRCSSAYLHRSITWLKARSRVNI